MKRTFPVGAFCCPPVTVAVMVTSLPNVDGDGAMVTAVDEDFDCDPTVWASAVETLGGSEALPRYLATIA
jgi:hypothetical protein